MTLYNMLQQATVFSSLSDPNYLLLIEQRRKAEPKEPVLVFDNLGISRAATIVTAYLMQSRKADLATAWNMVKKCLPNFRPNRGFVEQLSALEESICGAKASDVSDPYF
nr:hypothetical protein BaRGS_029609 [Batillaria attramentaria]